MGLAAISAGLSALGLADAPVGRLIGTHLHLDHVGVAPRLVADDGWRLVMHQRVPSLIDRYNDPARFVRETAAMAARHGAPPDEVAELATMDPIPDYFLPAEPPAETVEDGDRIPIGAGRYLEVIHTPGHEAAHICLRDSRTGVLFAGDHLLPRITPVIMWRDEDDDPLGDYLDGLDRFVGDRRRAHLPRPRRRHRPRRRPRRSDQSAPPSPARRRRRAARRRPDDGMDHDGEAVPASSDRLREAPGSPRDALALGASPPGGTRRIVHRGWGHLVSTGLKNRFGVRKRGHGALGDAKRSSRASRGHRR